MRSATQSSKLDQSQSGMVAIFVTMLMIIVISLIVLGFAQVTRRNQRNTLDSQLSSQAYYAAESGVNDAASDLQKKIVAGAPLPSKTTCAMLEGSYDFTTKNMLTTDVGYTCLLIDPNPSSLNYKLGTQAVVVPLISANSSQTFKSITLTWTPEEGHGSDPITGCYSLANLGKFPNASGASAWGCKFAALRTDLLDASVLSRASWQASTTVNVLVPINMSSSTAMPAATDGQPVAATCTNIPLTCRLTITFSGPGSARYYMRVSAIYRTTNLAITGTTAAGTAAFSSAQVKVDVTGKAQDVLRRILVGLDVSGNSGVKANSALSVADSVCKRFSVTAGSFSNEAYVGGGGNNLCEAAAVGTPSP